MKRETHHSLSSLLFSSRVSFSLFLIFSLCKQKSQQEKDSWLKLEEEKIRCQREPVNFSSFSLETGIPGMSGMQRWSLSILSLSLSFCLSNRTHFLPSKHFSSSSYPSLVSSLRLFLVPHFWFSGSFSFWAHKQTSHTLPVFDSFFLITSHLSPQSVICLSLCLCVFH